MIKYQARSVPEIPNTQGSGVGRAGEKVGSGVGSRRARGTEAILGSPNPLQVGVEGRAEARSKLRQCGAVRAGERLLLLRNRRRISAKDSVWSTGS